MKLRVSAKNMNDKLSKLSRLFIKSKIDDYTSKISICARDSYLDLYVVNDDISVSDRIYECSSDCNFSFLFDAATLISFFKSKKGDIDIVLSDDYSAKFFYRNGEFEYVWEDDSKFPEVFRPSGSKIRLRSSYFVPVLKRCFSFLANDEFRESINRVLIKNNNGYIDVVATDRFKLFKSTKESYIPDSMEFLISEKCASILYQYASDDDIDLYMSTDNKRTFIEFGDTFISDMGTEMKYPNYSLLFDKFSPTTSFDVEKSSFLSSLESSAIANTTDFDIVISNNLTITASNILDRKKVKESIGVLNINGQEDKMRVSSKNLIASVKNIIGDSVRFEYSNTNKLIGLYNPKYNSESILCSTLVI